MRKILLSLFIMILSTLSLADTTSDAQANVSVAQSTDNNDQQADVERAGVIKQSQPIYTLHLPANPTTGYSWFLVSYPEKDMQVLKHIYLAPNAKQVGAGGYDVWQFKAKASAFTVPRVFEIKMMYARSWMISKDTPVKTFYVVTQA